MKNLLFCIFIFCCLATRAQITLEHSYDSISGKYYGVVNFSQNGQKYLFVHRNNGSVYTINLYSLDHSLYKSITVPQYTGQSSNYITVFAVSDSLFNTDSKIEFGVQYEGSFASGAVVIYDEDTNILFTQDSVVMADVNNEYFAPNTYTIVKTNNGTKMVLIKNYYYPTIYSLPGSYSGIVSPAGQNGQILDAYPNPSHNSTTVKYELPEGVNEGQLKVYDMSGHELKSYRVDRTFNDLLIDNSSLSSGTYLYQLSTAQGAVGTKKIFVIR